MKTTDKLRIGIRILSSRLGGPPRPFFVQYSLLNACNARCAYCVAPDGNEARLTLDEHRRVLSEFARLGAVRVKFLGGEPLLHREIGELIDFVKSHGMRAAMVTNGLLIPANLDAVRRLDDLVISLDGSQTAHDGQRGAGTWRQVMASVELCAREGLDFFLSAVVTRANCGEIDWLIDTARRLGVMVNFQIPQFNPAVYGADAKAWMPRADEIRAVIDRIMAAKRAGAPVLFTTRSYRCTRDWPDYGVERIELPGETTSCGAGRYFVHMEPNGDLYPCVLHVGTFAPQNVSRDGVHAAWKHAQRHSCIECYNTWLNENRAIFDLHPAVLGNFWRNYLRPRWAARVSNGSSCVEEGG